MTPLSISLLVLLCIFGASVVGLFVRPLFPEGHLSADTKDMVKLVMGVIGTMTGMVLGLLVASAKSSFDSQRDGVSQVAANVIVLDRALAHFGPEALPARDALRSSLGDTIQRIWPGESSKSSASGAAALNDARYGDTAQLRWLLYSQRSNALPPVFLVLWSAGWPLCSPPTACSPRAIPPRSRCCCWAASWSRAPCS